MDVSVTALRSSDGAILDPDDRLADVVDDREQLAACLSSTNGGSSGSELEFEPRIGFNLRGDGTSASSNSPSPDFMHHYATSNANAANNGSGGHPLRKDVEVTGQESSTLQVRRGSEPALNRISPNPHSGHGSTSSGMNLHPHMEPTSTRDYKVK